MKKELCILVYLYHNYIILLWSPSFDVNFFLCSLTFSFGKFEFIYSCNIGFYQIYLQYLLRKQKNCSFEGWEAFQ